MSSVEDINRKIEAVAKEILEVKTAFTTWENDLVKKENDYDFWKKRLQQLGDKENKLRDEKNNLQTEKNNLQAKENLLLQRQSDNDNNNNNISFHISPNLIAAAKQKSITLRQFVVQVTSQNEHFEIIEHVDDQPRKVKKFFKDVCENGTIVSNKFIATHAHGLFEFIEQEREFNVKVWNHEGHVKCKVYKKSNLNDCTILTPVDPEYKFNFDIGTINGYPGELIISVGRSAVYQIDSADSVDISNITSDKTDHRGHLKMSRATAPGDSGGGVFDFFNGWLVGIMVAAENYGNHFGQYASRGSIVPIFIISLLCGEDLFKKA